MGDLIWIFFIVMALQPMLRQRMQIYLRRRAIAQLQAALRLKPAEKNLRAQITALVQRKAARDQAEREANPQRVVMVVDDSPTIRKLVAMTLEKEGHRVIAAVDGHAAVDCIRQQGVPGSAVGLGSLIKIHFSDRPVRDYRSAQPDAAGGARRAEGQSRRSHV